MYLFSFVMKKVKIHSWIAELVLYVRSRSVPKGCKNPFKISKAVRAKHFSASCSGHSFLRNYRSVALSTEEDRFPKELSLSCWGKYLRALDYCGGGH